MESAQSLKRGLAERRREIELAAIVLPSPTGDADALRLWLRRLQEASPFYALIGFIDSSGRVVTTSNRLAEGADVSARDYFRIGIRHTFVSDAHKAILLAKALGGADSMLRLIDIAAPIYRDEKVVGVLAAHLTTDWVADTGGYIAQRVITHFPGALFEIRSVAGEPIFTASSPSEQRRDPNAALAATSEASASSDDLEATAEVNEIDENNALRWTIVIRAPASDAFAYLRKPRIFAFYAAMAALAVSALLGRMFANRLAAPLEGYLDDLVALSWGAAPRFRPSPVSEINDLGAALQMSYNHRENKSD